MISTQGSERGLKMWVSKSYFTRFVSVHLLFFSTSHFVDMVCRVSNRTGPKNLTQARFRPRILRTCFQLLRIVAQCNKIAKLLLGEWHFDWWINEILLLENIFYPIYKLDTRPISCTEIQDRFEHYYYNLVWLNIFSNRYFLLYLNYSFYLNILFE